jgi:cell division protein FtsB
MHLRSVFVCCEKPGTRQYLGSGQEGYAEKIMKKEGVLLSIAIFLLLSLFFFIIVSEHGLNELIFLKTEHNKLGKKKERLSQENNSIRVEIHRLKHDPEYIENIARQELGMVAEGEIILKPQNTPNR